MKAGKDVGRDSEKSMDPLFPRLHINDADNGGPRAPPRNKMALYEQLNVPSHRFGSSRPSAPVLSRSDGGLSPSGSSQGAGHDRSISASPSVRRTPAFSTDKAHSWSSNGLNTNVASSSRESKLAKNIISKASNITSQLPEAATCAFHPPLVSKTGDSGGWKLRGKDDCAVLCANRGIESRLDEGKVTLNNPAFSGHCTSNIPSTSKMHVIGGCYSRLNIAEGQLVKESNVADPKSRHSCVSGVGHGKCLAEGKTSGMIQVVGPMKKIRSSPNTEPVDSEHLGHMKSMPSQAFINCFLNDVSNVCKFRTFIRQESTAGLSSDENGHNGEVSTRDRWNTDADAMKREVFLRIRSKLSSRELAEKANENPIKSTSNRNVLPDDRTRADDVSETSMMGSSSSLEVSPDDVVGVIGPKQFWKARRAILNQQRMFAVQVFELHRLIKVQKFLAGSPEFLIGEDLIAPLEKIAAGKVLPGSSYESVPLEPTNKQKDGLPISSETIKCLSDNPEKPASSVNNIMNKRSGGQEPSHGCSDGSPSQCHITTDSRTTAWCFPPLGSQWLVPVMSPSEGLIYMPITSPCSPTAGFLAPFYGACGPLSLPAVGGDIAKPTYGLLPSHQQGRVAILSSAPSYFPQGLHVVNPIASNPNAGEQASTPSVSRVSGQAEFSAADVNKSMHPRGSYYVSNQKADALSCHIWTFQASKGSDFNGSTSSNHCETDQEAAGHASKGRDSLHLFPLTSAMEGKSNQEHEHSNQHNHSQVIKVVPHNARSASESAARIFRSIQKERQPYDC
ncbi:protein EARLY FLOWERING 3-like isoform X1 [Nymphaea colorata]|nr:protein EARLY FLOWERING 3-like isoform X1 [Nymphaea colorata]